MRVAITGASGNLGTALITHTQRDHPAVALCALSRSPLRVPLRAGSVRVEYDAERGVSPDDLVGVDCLVHLAYLVEEPRDKYRARLVNVDAVENILDAAQSAGVSHVVVMSSVNAYGPRFGRDDVVDESDEPRRFPGKFYFDNKAEMEIRLRSRVSERPESWPTVTILRPTYIVGPDMDNSGIDTFRSRVLVYPRADDAIYQFIHQDDVCRAIWTVLENELNGCFNVGPEDYLTVREVAAMNDAVCVSLPVPVAEWVMNLAYRLHLSTYSAHWVTPGEARATSMKLQGCSPWRPSLSCAEAASAMLADRTRGWMVTAGQRARELCRSRQIQVPTYSDHARPPTTGCRHA
jgi:UDP-glucose 4-epimerase